LRSVIYPLGVALLIPVSSAAYPSLAAATMPAARTAPLPAISLVVATTPPPPVTTVLAPSDADRLRRDLTAIAAGSGRRVGISLQELSGPRRTSLSINGGQSFYAASAYKLPLLMAQAQQIAAGQVRPSDVLCYEPSDAEDGWFADYDDGSCFSRQDLAVRAGRYSDNTAARILVRYLGGPNALNAFARSIGMGSSALWIPNTTTPDDLAQAWINEELGRLGGARAQQWLYPILTHTAFEQGIPAGMPGGVAVVHKVGSLNGTENDSAYVTDGRVSYVLAVAVEGPDEVTGFSLIAQVSARVFQYERGRPSFVVPVIASPASPAWPDRRH
ncbi:MAG: serine hydrolase, partial [Chloroflexi bacterium]